MMPKILKNKPQREKARKPFDCLILTQQKRLGGEISKMGLISQTGKKT